eukprot:COSAG02_NODE_51857_length_311_cov_0.971698_1_plen_70_part_10
MGTPRVRAVRQTLGPAARLSYQAGAMGDAVMEVEDIGDDLADLDALEESLTSGMQPGAVATSSDAPDSEK